MVSLRNVGLKRMSKILHNTFMDLCKVDVYRTSKQFDEITGADNTTVDFDSPVLTDVDAYMSSTPWFPPEEDANEARMSMRANYRIHVTPDNDIRTGDVVRCKLANGVQRYFIVPRVAYYPTHTRLEVFEWDYRNNSIDLTGVVSIPDWNVAR